MIAPLAVASGLLVAPHAAQAYGCNTSLPDVTQTDRANYVKSCLTGWDDSNRPNTISGDGYAKFAIWAAEADFSSGNIAQGQQRVATALANKGASWPFFQVAFVDLMNRFGSQLTQAQKDDFFDYMNPTRTGGSLTGGSIGNAPRVFNKLGPSPEVSAHPDPTLADDDTPNHWFMRAVAISQASELDPSWPTDSVADQNFPKENDTTVAGKDIEDHLIDYLDRVALKGFAEQHSSEYEATYLVSLKVLAEFSDHPVLREKAKLAYESLLTQIGTAWNSGDLGWSGTTRTYDARRFGTVKTSETSCIGYVLFGGPRPSSTQAYNTPGYTGKPYCAYAAQEAVATTTLPAAVASTATDRNGSFLATSRHDLGYSSTAPWHSSAWVTPTYELSSQTRTTAYGNGSQTHDWRLQWLATTSTYNSNNAFYVKHPVSVNGVTGEPEGSTNSFPVLQRNGALIGVSKPNAGENGRLYAIAPTTGITTSTSPYAPPTTIGGCGNPTTNWWGFKSQNVLVAVKFALPLRDCGLLATSQSRQYQSSSANNGFVMETAPVTAYGGNINTFVAAAANNAGGVGNPATAMDTSHLGDADPYLVYTSLAGEVLKITRSGVRTVGGVDVDPGASAPLLSSPFVETNLATANDRRVSGQTATRIYDYTTSTWAASDSIPFSSGTFETGTATVGSGWTTANWAGTGTYARGLTTGQLGADSNGQTVSVSSAANAGVSVLAGSRPAAVVGKRTTVSAWTKRTGVTGVAGTDGVYLWAQYYDAAGNAIGTAASSTPLRGSLGWKSYSVTLPAAPSNAATVGVSLRLKGTAGSVAFDNVHVTRW